MRGLPQFRDAREEAPHRHGGGPNATSRRATGVRGEVAVRDRRLCVFVKEALDQLATSIEEPSERGSPDALGDGWNELWLNRFEQNMP